MSTLHHRSLYQWHANLGCKIPREAAKRCLVHPRDAGRLDSGRAPCEPRRRGTRFPRRSGCFPPWHGPCSKRELVASESRPGGPAMLRFTTATALILAIVLPLSALAAEKAVDPKAPVPAAAVVAAATGDALPVPAPDKAAPSEQSAPKRLVPRG